MSRAQAAMSSFGAPRVPLALPSPPPKHTPSPASSRFHVIGPDDVTARYRGCRIDHGFALGTVGLRIHGGARGGPAARDVPVQCLLTVEDLDELIVHLMAIRAEMRASVAARGC